MKWPCSWGFRFSVEDTEVMVFAIGGGEADVKMYDVGF